MLRPARFRARQNLLDQLTGLGQKCVVIAAEWPQDKLRHAGVDIFGDAREYRVGVADRERVAGVTTGAFGVGIHRLADTGRVPAAEVEREAGAIMIFVDGSARFAGGGLDRGHDATGLRRRVAAGLPTGADARRAPDRGLRRATDPHRQIWLYRLWRDGDALQLVEGAAEVDRLLSPEASDDIEALVGFATARPGVDVERLPFGRQRAA